MANEGCGNKKTIEISGSDSTDATSWKGRYLVGLNGRAPKLNKAMTLE